MVDKPKSQEELERLMESQQMAVRRLDIPSFNASSFSLTIAVSEFSLICARQHPVVVGEGTSAINASAAEPVMVMNLSAQSAKDLATLLLSHVADYEREWGEITTAFTRRVAQSAAGK